MWSPQCRPTLLDKIKWDLTSGLGNSSSLFLCCTKRATGYSMRLLVISLPIVLSATPSHHELAVQPTCTNLLLLLQNWAINAEYIYSNDYIIVVENILRAAGLLITCAVNLHPQKEKTSFTEVKFLRSNPFAIK